MDDYKYSTFIKHTVLVYVHWGVVGNPGYPRYPGYSGYPRYLGYHGYPRYPHHEAQRHQHATAPLGVLDGRGAGEHREA